MGGGWGGGVVVIEGLRAPWLPKLIALFSLLGL